MSLTITKLRARKLIEEAYLKGRGDMWQRHFKQWIDMEMSK